MPVIVNEGPSRQVLAETPGRVLTFISAIGTSAAVRATLEERGYTEATHLRFWRLLLKLCGYGGPAASPSLDEHVRAARDELDGWDEPGFGLASAALKHEYPSAHAYLFENLQASTGANAVLGVAKFLERLSGLAIDPARKKTRKEDAAALDKLATRGITLEERARLQALVDIATGAATVDMAPPPPPAMTPDDRDAALRELRALYEEWSDIARIVVKRRLDLIRLGLAKRRKPGSDKAAPQPMPNGDSPLAGDTSAPESAGGDAAPH